MCSCVHILVELPHDTFAEQYVLASCLKRPDLIAPCRLQPSDFYHRAHRQDWAVILEVGADLGELGETLRYGLAYLALWQADRSLPSQGALAAAAPVRDCARHRDLASVAQRLAERAGDASRPLTADEASVLGLFALHALKQRRPMAWPRTRATAAAGEPRAGRLRPRSLSDGRWHGVAPRARS